MFKKRGGEIMQVIYKIVNTLNGKYYVGRTGNLANRIAAHQYLLREGRHHSIHLQKAWDKYDKDVWNVVEFCKIDTGSDDDDIRYAQAIESSFLSKENIQNILYNVSESSITGTIRGRKHHYYGKHPSEWMGEAYYANIERDRFGENNPFYGKEHSEETKNILREKCALYGENNGFYGKKHTPESIEKMKRARSFQNCPVSIEGVIYESIREASRKSGYSRDQIRYRLDKEGFPEFVRM